MKNAQTVIVVLLVIAIVFSALSVIINMSYSNFKPVNYTVSAGETIEGNPAGNVNIVVEKNIGGQNGQ